MEKSKIKWMIERAILGTSMLQAKGVRPRRNLPDPRLHTEADRETLTPSWEYEGTYGTLDIPAEHCFFCKPFPLISNTLKNDGK